MVTTLPVLTIEYQLVRACVTKNSGKYTNVSFRHGQSFESLLCMGDVDYGGSPIVDPRSDASTLRGYFTEADLNAIHQRMADDLAPFGVTIDDLPLSPARIRAAMAGSACTRSASVSSCTSAVLGSL